MADSFRLSIAFQSDKAGELDIYAATVVDINAPTLVFYDVPSREIVHTALDGSPETPQRKCRLCPSHRRNAAALAQQPTDGS